MLRNIVSSSLVSETLAEQVWNEYQRQVPRSQEEAELEFIRMYSSLDFAGISQFQVRYAMKGS